MWYWFLRCFRNLYDYPSNSYFVLLAASFLAYEHGYLRKYLIRIPMYKHKFVWPYFKQIDLIFPVLVFAYKLQSPSKVCHTNSYVTLEICMTILQTASLCRWQHHFRHTNMVTFESILKEFPCTNTNLYDHILNR